MHTRFITITDARKDIFSLTDTIAKKNAVITLTEHGLPKAILLSPKRYDRLERLLKRKQTRSEQKFPLILSPAWSVRDASHQSYSQNTDSLLSLPSSRGAIDTLATAKKIAVAQLFIQLAEEYGYPPQCLYLDICVRTDGHDGNRSIDIDLLLTDAKGNPEAIFLAAPFQKYESFRERSLRDLFEVSRALKKEYRCTDIRHLVYFSKTVGDSAKKDFWTIVDARTFSSFAQWKRAGFPAETVFPKKK